MPELTLNDLALMIQRNATKEDIDNIVTARINTYQQQTNEQIDEIRQQVDSANVMNNVNADRIEELQATVESLKQDQLKNNICISGVPASQITDDNTAQIVIAIGKTLNVNLTASQFTSYAVANKKFIITHFYNYKHKRDLLMNVRAKKSLMAEEVLSIQSNSQIYLNDHLTPYLNSLHILAREAKKLGKLASVSSYGGKIRVRKSINDSPTVILSERQLNAIIDMDYNDNSTDTNQHASDMSVQSTSTQISTNAHQYNNGDKPHQRRQHRTSNNNTRTKPTKRRVEETDAHEVKQKEKKTKNSNNASQKSAHAQR